MSQVITLCLVVLALAGGGLLVGWPLLIGLFGFPARRWPESALILAPPVGVLVLGLASYAVSSGLALGLSITGPLVVATLLAVSLAYFSVSRQCRKDFLHIFCANAWIVGIVFFLAPVSFAHVILPMLRQDWLMAYAIGNDGARYLMMIDYLQEHCWRYGDVVAQTLGYPMGNRPVMHYLSALPVSLFPVSSYLAYSISVALAAWSIAMSGMGVGLFLFRASRAVQIASAFLVFSAAGLSGHLMTLYYTAFLGQYYAIIPLLVALVSFALISAGKVRFLVWAVFIMLSTASVYSVGNVMVSLLVILLGLLFLMAFGELRPRRGAYCATALLGAAGLAFLLFRYELSQANHFFGGRNAGYDYGLFNSLLIMTGMISKYHDYRGMLFSYKLAFAAPVLFLTAVALAQGLRQGLPRAFCGVLCGLAFLYAYLYTTGQYYLVNKTSVFFLPVLLVSAPGILSIGPIWRGEGLLRLGLALATVLAVGGMAAKGLLDLTVTYETIAASRVTYISPQMLAAKREMLSRTGPVRIVSADAALERTLLMRQFFAEFAWQPLYGPDVWPEYGVRAEAPPADFAAYSYDYLVAGLDVNDTMDYLACNRASLLFQFSDRFAVFDGSAGLVDFGPNWTRRDYRLLTREPVPRFGRSVVANSAEADFIVVDKRGGMTLELVLVPGVEATFAVDGTAVESLRPAASNGTVRLQIPLGNAGGVHKVTAKSSTSGLEILETRFEAGGRAP